MTDSLLISLNDAPVGVLTRREDERVDFRFLPEYLGRAAPPVLGQWFLDHPGRVVSSRSRIPAWFSNLLPEGALRSLVAEDLHVSPQREFELLRRLGEDLPGAVRATPAPDGILAEGESEAAVTPPSGGRPDAPLKFSLAGVQLKFSMLLEGKKLTLPSRGMGGDWIVKLPDARFEGVPRNEFAMMSLARAAGIEVPDVNLVQMDHLEGLPALPPLREAEAYAVRRYDRTSAGRVHQEDFAQVLNEYPERKYEAANYETVANIVLRTIGEDALDDFVRRLVFSIAIGNGDAHLKNWSLLYPRGQRPRLSPAYDLVSSVLYIPGDRLGLNFARSKAWEDIGPASFVRLATKLGVRPSLVLDAVSRGIAAFEQAWANEAANLPLSSEERARLDAHRARIPLLSEPSGRA